MEATHKIVADQHCTGEAETPTCIQAVLIEEWEREDGTREGPKAALPPPTAADLTAAGVCQPSALYLWHVQDCTPATAWSVGVPYNRGQHRDDGQHTDAPVRAVAETAVADQAEVVRELKEGQGLNNKDEPVVAAVEELLRRKQRVTALQEALEQLVVQ